MNLIRFPALCTPGLARVAVMGLLFAAGNAVARAENDDSSPAQDNFAIRKSNQSVAEAIAKAARAVKLGGMGIEVEFANGQAVLRGTVKTDEQRKLVERVTTEVAEVKTVKNELKLSETTVTDDKAESDPAVRAKPQQAKDAKVATQARQIKEKLRKQAEVRLERESLPEGIRRLMTVQEIPVRFDVQAIEAAGIDLDQTITIAVNLDTLDDSLQFVLSKSGLSHTVEDGELVIAVAAKSIADRIREKLKQKADVRVSKQSLRVALPELAKKHGIPLRFDEDSIKVAEIDLDKVVSASMAGATLDEGLKFVLDTAGLKHLVEEDALVITAGKVRPAEPAEEAAADVAVQVVNLQAQEQQVLRQLRPLLRVEINFIRAICRSDADGQRKINEDGERLLKAAAKAYTQMMRGGMFPGQTQSDPRKVIRDGLAKSVGKHLSAEQLRLYREEISLRDADRRTAAIDSCLAILDEKLVLTVEQREKLSASLTADWKDEWCPSLETFLYGNEYFPNIPARILTPVLTKPQQKVWNAMPKNTGMVFGGFGFGFMGLGDDGGEDAEVIEVPAEPVALPDDVPQIDGSQIQDEAPP